MKYNKIITSNGSIDSFLCMKSSSITSTLAMVTLKKVVCYVDTMDGTNIRKSASKLEVFSASITP